MVLVSIESQILNATYENKQYKQYKQSSTPLVDSTFPWHDLDLHYCSQYTQISSSSEGMVWRSSTGPIFKHWHLPHYLKDFTSPFWFVELQLRATMSCKLLQSFLVVLHLRLYLLQLSSPVASCLRPIVLELLLLRFPSPASSRRSTPGCHRFEVWAQRTRCSHLPNGQQHQGNKQS